MNRLEKIYIIGALMAVAMVIGTSGSLEIGAVTLREGGWQMLCAVVLALWMCNGIRLEETRAARRVVR